MTGPGVLASWDGVSPAQAGPLGLLVILLLAGAVVFLYKSMKKQLAKVPASFDDPPEPKAPDESSPNG
jgi:uncharacterized protein involved in response to NO